MFNLKKVKRLESEIERLNKNAEEYRHYIKWLQVTTDFDVPNARVGTSITHFFMIRGEWNRNKSPKFVEIKNPPDQADFILKFDSCADPTQLPEQEFEVEIPDEVIEFYYGDVSKAVQKLIDNPILKVADYSL